MRAALKQEKSGVLVNLASLEYFNAITADRLDIRVITPVFKERQNSGYRVVAICAQKARGRMCDFIIRNRPNRPEDLKAFSRDG